MSIKHIEDYEDCNVFKPGEIWQSPRGTFHRVLSSKVAHYAEFRQVADANGTPLKGGRWRMILWSEVKNWVRVRAAEPVKGKGNG